MAKRRTKAEIEQDNKTEAIRLRFTNWLYRTYEVSFLPKYFFINLDKVYKGTYKNLNKPVPVEDLWDMWQRKLPYLMKVYDKNVRSGKTMEGIARISYDMAIVLSKYDSYLSWKENQQRIQAEQQERDKEIQYTKLTKPVSSSADKDEINLSDILDEI